MDAIERLRELAESRTHLPIRGPDARAILAHIDDLAAELAAAKAERGRLERHISAHQAMWDADYKIAQDAIASGAHLTSEVG